MGQSLQINLTNSSASGTGERRFVHLTQPVESGMDKTATMFDISQMIARAEAGNSAHSYKKNNCPAGVTDTGITIRLDFEAWPSSPDLPYSLEASIGNVSLPTVIDEYTEFPVIFDKSDVEELDFMLAEICSYRWETDCFTPLGETLQAQTIAMDGLTTIRTEQKIFGVCRILGKKIGAQHRLTHKLLKSFPVRPDTPLPEEGISNEDLEKYWGYTDIQTWNGEPMDASDTINSTGLLLENLSITITARWKNLAGEEETSSMRLTVPQCVKDLLATCDGKLENFGGEHSGTSICDLSDRPDQLTVYISGCTGDELDKRSTKEDPDSWCE